MHDPKDLTAVSPEILRELWTIFRSETTLQACRNIIVSRLLSGGVSYADSKGGELVDENFFDHCQRNFVTFARDIIDSMCVQGFAAFTLNAKDNTPNVVPPGAGRYSVHIDPQSYVRSLVMEDSHTAKINPRVLFVVDNWPTDGVPVSPVASYRRLYGFKSMVEMNTATADYFAARPLVYTTVDSAKAFNPKWIYENAIGTGIDQGFGYAVATQQGNTRNFTAARPGGGFVNDAATQEDTRSVVTRRADAAIGYVNRIKQASAATEYHERLAADLNSGNLSFNDVRIDPFTGLPVFDMSANERARQSKENVVELPIDTHYVATVTPHSRPDLVPILEHSTRHACICMGVPPTGLGVVNAHSSLEASTSEDVLKSTLLRFQRILTRSLTDVYVGLYGKRKDLVVVFPSLLTTSIAKSLYDSNIMSYEAFCKHMRNTYSIPRMDLAKEEPDIDEGGGIAKRRKLL